MDFRGWALGAGKLLILCSLTLWTSGCATFTRTERSTGVVYTVRVEKGDTLASIATRFDTDWRAIARENRIGPKRELKIGQTLRVRPGPAGLAAGSEIPQAPASQVAPAGIGNGSDPTWKEDDITAPPAERKNQPRKGLLFGAGGKTGASVTGQQVLFKWPVPGSISSKFGPRWGRFHNGIDIRAPRGTPIRAAMDGRVIFSGRQRGYGKTVIINHGNYRTLYGHAGKLLVKQGEWVDAGHVVGLVGATGNSRGVHLHFEIRTAGDRPIDPLPLMESRLVSSAPFAAPQDRITSAWLLASR